MTPGLLDTIAKLASSSSAKSSRSHASMGGMGDVLSMYSEVDLLVWVFGIRVSKRTKNIWGLR